MEYSIMERGPVVAMCMKVDPAPRPGYGYCQLKPTIMVNDGKSNKSSYFQLSTLIDIHIVSWMKNASDITMCKGSIIA